MDSQSYPWTVSFSLVFPRPSVDQSHSKRGHHYLQWKLFSTDMLLILILRYRIRSIYSLCCGHSSCHIVLHIPIYTGDTCLFNYFYSRARSTCNWSSLIFIFHISHIFYILHNVSCYRLIQLLILVIFARILHILLCWPISVVDPSYIIARKVSILLCWPRSVVFTETVVTLVLYERFNSTVLWQHLSWAYNL